LKPQLLASDKRGQLREAVESQEGLKRVRVVYLDTRPAAQYVESQEGLKPVADAAAAQTAVQVESQEGLKRREEGPGGPREGRLGVESQEGLKRCISALTISAIIDTRPRP